MRFCPKGKGGKGKGGKSVNCLGSDGKEVALGGEAAQVAQGASGTQAPATKPEPEAKAVNYNIQMMGYGAGYGGYSGPGCCQQWTPWTDQWGCYSLEEVRVNILEEVQGRAKAQTALNAVTPEVPKLNREQRAQLRERLASKFSKTHDRFRVCPDSGSWKMVANKRFALGVKMTESEGSKNSVHYKCASDTLIANEGEKTVEGNDINGHKLKSKWQIADVTKPLAGVIEGN